MHSCTLYVTTTFVIWFPGNSTQAGLHWHEVDTGLFKNPGFDPHVAVERLREIDAEHLVYERAKPGPGGSVSLLLTPLELLDRLAALIPPPRRHRHSDLGVLAPNAPLRAVVTALAQPDAAEHLATSEVPSAAPDDDIDEPLHRKAARLVWAMLIARIDEVLPLL